MLRGDGNDRKEDKKADNSDNNGNIRNCFRRIQIIRTVEKDDIFNFVYDLNAAKRVDVSVGQVISAFVFFIQRELDVFLDFVLRYRGDMIEIIPGDRIVSVEKNTEIPDLIGRFRPCVVSEIK